MDAVEKIIWTDDAIKSLEDIVHYIAEDSPYYAGGFAKDILVCIEKLTDFPLMGRIVPEYDNPEIRELIYQNYRIVYKISTKKIFIVLVVHGSRKLPVDLG